MQSHVLSLFTSRELFILRGVCGEFSDMTKQVWCQVVKFEMLQQVQSLDLLYEKETTGKLLEFKLKYLVSYAQLMRNYFMHMNFTDMIAALLRTNDVRGRQLMVICANVVGPNETQFPVTIAEMNEEIYIFTE